MPSDDKKSVNLNPEFAQIQQSLSRLLANESAAKKSFQTLYEELESYKNDFLFRHERVLLQDLLLFYDSLLWFSETSAQKPEKSSEYVQYLIDEFLEILRRRDVLPMEPKDKFDRKIHRIISTEPTEDESKAQSIHEILRRGFHRGEQVVRAEEIVIYRHVPHEEDTEDSSDDNSSAEIDIESSDDNVIAEESSNSAQVSITASVQSDTPTSE